jgi:tetratricopeptide (TPR) repeat protein
MAINHYGLWDAKKYVWGLLFIGILLATTLSSQAQTLSCGLFDRHISQGREYLAKSEYAEAVDEFSCAIQISPTNPNGYIGRAFSYTSLNEFLLAQEDYEVALTKVAENSQVLPSLRFGYASNLYLLNELERSDVILLDLLVENSSNAQVLSLIGMIRIETGQYFDAIEIANALLAINASDPDAYFIRGTAYRGLGDLTRSSDDFEMVLRLSPNQVNKYVILGDTFAKDEQYRRAILMYGIALNLTPSDTWIFKRRFFSYVAIEEYNLAAQDIHQIESLRPLDFFTIFAAGFLYEFQCMDKEAIKYYRKFLAIATQQTEHVWISMSERGIDRLLRNEAINEQCAIFVNSM